MLQEEHLFLYTTANGSTLDWDFTEPSFKHHSENKNKFQEVQVQNNCMSVFT